jgi:hypothetical protein
MTHIADPFAQNLYRTGISVGDYPIDHHHKKNPAAPQQLEFYPVPSYNIPLGALIPESVEGLIVAEKGISVSNVANGTTRLQPVVMLTGQAAGALAALAVQRESMARTVPVRAVQNELLAYRAFIMPYNDVKPDHPYFKSIQRVGATGILKGKPTPSSWANRTWFYPDSLIDAQAFIKDIKSVLRMNGSVVSQHLSLGEAIVLLQTIDISIPVEQTVKQKFRTWGWKDADPSRLLTRGELAKMIDDLFDPFRIQVNHMGNAEK